MVAVAASFFLGRPVPWSQSVDGSGGFNSSGVQPLLGETIRIVAYMVMYNLLFYYYH
jgi:hypothetical protein